MAAFKLLNLLALSSLAIVACSFGPEPVNALSSGHQARDIGLRGHDALAKRKRNVNAKRCKPRSPPSASAGSTSYAAPTADPTTSVADTAPASTADSSAAPAATTNASSSSGNSGSSGGGKACLAWPNGDQPYLKDYKTDKTSTLYTWGPTCPSTAASLGFDCIPMMWGDKDAAEFSQTVQPGSGGTILFINEPNEAGQSNMSPQHAADLWHQYIGPLQAAGTRCGSPATSSNPNGLQWMKDFLAACNCQPDFFDLHWYDVSADGFKTYVELWHNTFNAQIWVTEFAYQNFNGGPQGDFPTIQGFMSDVTSWMEEQSYVEKYCWFGAMLDMQGVNTFNSLMNPDGSPSTLGNQFLY